MLNIDEIEPVFNLFDNSSLRLDVNEWSDKANRYLAHAVVRVPDNLHVHVQRIHLAMHRDSASELYGALIDLFISLGNNGEALREHMLMLGKDQLDNRSYSFLKNALKSSLKSRDIIPGEAISVLSEGYVGEANILIQPEQNDSPEHDPLTLAESFMEYGDLYSARALLEIEVLQRRSTAEQELQLLDIYHTIGDPALFNQIYSISGKCKLVKPEGWKALADQFMMRNG